MSARASEVETLRFKMKPANTLLHPANPGAAQSIPVGLLCLLSGHAAQAHVGPVNMVTSSSFTSGNKEN